MLLEIFLVNADLTTDKISISYYKLRSCSDTVISGQEQSSFFPG